MKRNARMTATALVASFVLGILSLPYLVNVDRFRPQLESYLASELGRKVEIGELSLSLFSGGVSAKNVAIADDPEFRDQPFVRTKSIKVGVSLFPLLLAHSLHVSSLTLEDPEITLLRSSAGKWNFSSIGNGGAVDQPIDSDTPSTTSSWILDKVKMSNATVVVENMDVPSGRNTYEHLEAEAKINAPAGAVEFVLRGQSSNGGSIEVAGQARPAARGNIAQTPFHATIEAKHLQWGDSALGSSSDLRGYVNLRSRVAFDGSVLESEGSGQIERLLLVRGGHASSLPVSFRYQTEYFMRRKTGFFRSAEIAAGESHASLAGTYAIHEQGTVVHLNLAGSQLALNDVRGILSAFSVTLPAGSSLEGGTMDAHIALDGPITRLVTSGNVEMAGARLARFNLGSKLSSIPALSTIWRGADLFIVSLSSRFRIAPAGIYVSHFSTQLSGIGGMSGQGTIDRAGKLDFHLTASLAKDGLVNRAVELVPALSRMPHEIPLLLRGTAAKPLFAPDPDFVKNLIVEKLKDRLQNSLKENVSQKVKDAYTVRQINAPCGCVQTNRTQQVADGDSKGKFHGVFRHMVFWRKKDKKQDSQNHGKPDVVAAKN